MQPRAGFWIRLAAAILDALLLYGLNLFGFTVTTRIFSATGGLTSPSLMPMFVAWLGFTAVAWLAVVATEAWGRASPAKRLFGLRIAGSDDAAVTRGRLMTRAAVKYAPLLAYLVVAANIYWSLERRPNSPGGVVPASVHVALGFFLLFTVVVAGGFLAALGRRRQALHDRIAGTVVIRRGDEGAGFAPVMQA